MNTVTAGAGSLADFARVLQIDPIEAAEKAGGNRRLNLDQANVGNGLGRLVLQVVKLLHDLLERQAIRRIDAGSLTADEIERVGVTLMRQAQEIDRLRATFGLQEADLDIELGPLGKLLSS